jgi:hypothetical protein
MASLFLLVCILGIAPVGLGSAAVGPAPQLYIDPSESNVWVRQIFSVNITILNIEDLYGFEFKLNYNTTILDCVEVIEGPFLKSAGSTYILKQEINDTLGLAEFAVSLYGTETGVTGSGVLATLKFNATGVGSSLLHLFDTLLGNSSALSIEHLVYDGSVKITLIPGDVNNDGVVDIFDLVLVGIAFGSEPGDPNWDERADLNGDGFVNILDAVIVGTNYGKSVF